MFFVFLSFNLYWAFEVFDHPTFEVLKQFILTARQYDKAIISCYLAWVEELAHLFEPVKKT
jgi:hypothetical protein